MIVHHSHRVNVGENAVAVKMEGMNVLWQVGDTCCALRIGEIEIQFDSLEDGARWIRAVAQGVDTLRGVRAFTRREDD